ncbi:metallophosphoesterase [Nocardia sp. NPDC057455]|uniref:metallophosphoesterase family protein n=1 Tax=Nocardia sp. NPDC057455 TaxID=3346138 RepID=UPI00366FC182
MSELDAWESLNPIKVVGAGDWHGNGNFAVRAVRYAADQGADVILHVGDFAFDFAPKYMAALQRALEDTGLTLGFVSGNHDSYDYLDKREAEHGCTAIPLRPNIYYLPRCYRWSWNGIRFLAMGGAVSVDRQWRIPGREWWDRETITFREAQKATDDGLVDVMICHDVPAGVHIPGIAGNPHGFPQREIDASEQHRYLLRQIVDQVQPKLVFSGHYHCRHTGILHGDGYTSEVHILDCDGAEFDDNMTVVDLGLLANGV